MPFTGTIHAVESSEPSTPERRRKNNPFIGAGCPQALAISWLRGYAADKARSRSGKKPSQNPARGPAGSNSQTHYDAAIVRAIDGDNIIATLKPRHAAALLVYFVHGERHERAATLLAVSERTARGMKQEALDALTLRLERVGFI